MRIVRVLSLVLLAVPLLTAQLTREDWSRADEAVVRLKPDAFPNLPDAVRAALEQHGCTIPQPYDAGYAKKNIISGHFLSSTASDWAALCSHEKRSAILIVPAGHSAGVERIAEEPDSQYLQVAGDGQKIGFSRLLSVASARQVRKHFAHASRDGIEDSFTGKGSLLWYHSGGKWIKIAAGD